MDETHIEEILCSKSVLYINQPVALVAAKTQWAADKAATLVKVQYSKWASGNKRKPEPGLHEAIAAGDFFPGADGAPDYKENGDVDAVFRNKNISTYSGTLYLPGQYHHFMEPHHATAIVQDDQVEINLGSQALDKVQRAVAYALTPFF